MLLRDNVAFLWWKNFWNRSISFWVYSLLTSNCFLFIIHNSIDIDILYFFCPCESIHTPPKRLHRFWWNFRVCLNGSLNGLGSQLVPIGPTRGGPQTVILRFTMELFVFKWLLLVIAEIGIYLLLVAIGY